jgi:hypothetical protein
VPYRGVVAAVADDDDTFSISVGDRCIPNDPNDNFLNKERERKRERSKEKRDGERKRVRGGGIT